MGHKYPGLIKQKEAIINVWRYETKSKHNHNEWCMWNFRRNHNSMKVLAVSIHLSCAFKLVHIFHIASDQLFALSLNFTRFIDTIC